MKRYTQVVTRVVFGLRVFFGTTGVVAFIIRDDYGTLAVMMMLVCGLWFGADRAAYRLDQMRKQGLIAIVPSHEFAQRFRVYDDE